MTTAALNPGIFARLAKYDTPTICNVIELFEVRPRSAGYMNQDIRASFPEMPPMVGLAATATFCSSEPSPGKDIYATLGQQLEELSQLPGPSVVVYEDTDIPAVGATFGEVMCSSYQAFGSVGLITSGGGRDLDQVRALDYPVFTGATICSHAYCHIVKTGDEVEVGGLKVNPGDLLHGDGNGVTNIPLDIAAELVEIVDEFVAAEHHVMEYVGQPGEKKVAELVERRRAMGADIAALRTRVSRNK